jgi:hypothetical protein
MPFFDGRPLILRPKKAIERETAYGGPGGIQYSTVCSVQVGPSMENLPFSYRTGS